MNNDPINCIECGKFVAYKFIETGYSYTYHIDHEGNASEDFQCQKCYDKQELSNDNSIEG